MKYPLPVKNTYKKIYSGHLQMKGSDPEGGSLDFSNYSMIRDGRPFYVISGEFHFSRYSCELWEEEIMKIKACGLDTIATYLFWNHYEHIEGVFDFSGNNDIRRFVTLCAKHGISVILRLGPYAHGECRNGGLPDWLFGRPFEVRSNDEGYLAFVRRYFHKIGEQVADLVYEKGGPIIAIQLENEYMAACSPWEITVTQNREWVSQGRDGLAHITTLRDIAREAGLRTPFITCTGWGGSPLIDGETLPLWGSYAYWPWLYWNHETAEHPATGGYLFENKHDESVQDGFDKKYPFACGEMGGGMQTFYTYRFQVEPESVEAMCLVNIADGCNFLGYYMFHGGCNPVINGQFTNEQLAPRISYDFQAPLGDFGQVRESYKRIKLIHMMLRDFNDFYCTAAPVVPPEKIEPGDTAKLRYAARSDGQKGFLFLNNYQDHVEQTDKTDVQIEVETDGGSIKIPRYTTMTIARNVSCVLPFAMEFGGLSLEYATVQYITKIEIDGIPVYFFFSHPGLHGEFCFAGDYETAECVGAQIETRAGRTLVNLPESGFSSFTLKNSGGAAVRFICMDRQQSLNFWKATVKGRDYALITTANVYFTEDTLFFENLENDSFPLLALPALPACVFHSTNIYADKSDGIFHSYTVSCPMPPLDLQITRPYENRVLLHFDAAVMENLSELYLDIDYVGDIGWAFIDGKLIHDNFSNGAVWRIGLKQFEDKLQKNDLYLYISPKTDSVKMESSSTYAKINIAENKETCFRSIRLIGEKTIALSM